MKICTLASSSKGNCTIVYNENTKILIDCGITISELTMKLQALGISPSEIDGVLVTHEHSDHTCGINNLAKRYGTTIYCHEDALYGIMQKAKSIPSENFIFFNRLPFDIGDFHIQPFRLPHDVPACVGYTIEENGVKFSIATDLGHITDEIIGNLVDSKLVILEANHDPDRLKVNPHYPSYLKARILGPNGHLSNLTSASVIEKLVYGKTKQVLLAHLSEENNTPDLAYTTIKDYLQTKGIVVGVNIKIDVLSPKNLSPIFVLK